MRRLVAYLFRFAAIAFGFFCATLAASAFLHVLILGGEGAAPGESPRLLGQSALASVPLFALFVAYFAFLPAIPAVLAAEFLGRRDWLFHALAGVVVAAVVWGLFRAGGETGLRAGEVFMAFIASGLVGGIAYWLVAGRNSGARLHAKAPRGSLEGPPPA